MARQVEARIHVEINRSGYAYPLPVRQGNPIPYLHNVLADEWIGIPIWRSAQDIEPDVSHLARSPRQARMYAVN